MQRLDLERKEIDIAKYKKRSAFITDVDNIIKKDTIVYCKDNPVILYQKLENDLTKNLRWSVKNTNFTSGKRSRGLSHISRTFGFSPRIAMRQDYCHTSSMAYDQPKHHIVLTKFADYLNDAYAKNFPDVFEQHSKQVEKKIKPEWKIANTPFTSGIINKNNPLKYHFDQGNFKGVMSNMIAFKKDVTGGHLVIPEFNIALEIEDNTLTIFDGQDILHGVSGFDRNNDLGYRYTIVYYSLEQMWKCEPVDQEVVRIRKIKQEREKKRLDPKHLETLSKRKNELSRQREKETALNKIKNEQNRTA